MSNVTECIDAKPTIMPPKPTEVFLAATAVTATSVASLSLSQSLILTPALLPLPTPLMLRQWAATHRRLSLAFPLAMVACGASYAGLASGAASSSRTRLLAAAAALCFGVVPWTWLLMAKRLTSKILVLADEAEVRAASVWTAQEERSAKWLVDQWAMYNLGRGIPVAVAGALGVFALVQ